MAPEEQATLTAKAPALHPPWVIETQNLTKIFDNRVIALTGVSLRVPQGSVFGLVGPNGSGKTTLFRHILGMQRPTAGSVQVLGHPMTANAANVRQTIGYLPTNPQFPPDMTPIHYLDFVGRLFALHTEIRKPRLASLLRAVDLLNAGSSRISNLSTGMRTRLGIAASLMNDPELVIWDEPTSGLDPAGRKYTIDLIQELGQERTMLVSSHILGDVDRVCNQIGVLMEGKLIFSGPTQEVKQLFQRNIIRLELAQALDQVEGQLDALQSQIGFTYKQDGPSLEIVFEQEGSLAERLSRVLALLAEGGVDVIAVNSEGNDLETALLQIMAEDESHGFSRAL